ncbi:hypothetical protein SAY87_013196 [Trapa incisa]|uniref:Uncharacterized protein n=1 Tax=Trapa incisa TaxID=236973 RepID=A0AAN7QCZ4_9MYRT|nr:hypothetical protein SAY87_013196 [Trapa incisa]
MDPYPPPQFPYYNPLVTWWMPPPPAGEHDTSDHTPTWVIVGLVAAVAIFIALLFMFLRKRADKDKHKEFNRPPPTASEPAKPAGEPPKKASTTADVPPPVEPKKDKAVAASSKELAVVPHFVPAVLTRLQQEPGNCASCRRKGGLYSLSYKCPKCIYKYEVGIHIQYPDKHQATH